ncbi:hypothetical protein NP493_25g04019 [Ridgeia piscesae]|uniref:Uncharacterized protein n=1 Tax=Ridgeia piscesae TaxID=27915 RepID=A0AAD9UKH3_RIDPI|nr:hypothetical protein NP493_25g04019 [Ridgeia piscesae]
MKDFKEVLGWDHVCCLLTSLSILHLLPLVVTVVTIHTLLGIMKDFKEVLGWDTSSLLGNAETCSPDTDDRELDSVEWYLTRDSEKEYVTGRRLVQKTTHNFMFWRPEPEVPQPQNELRKEEAKDQCIFKKLLCNGCDPGKVAEDIVASARKLLTISSERKHADKLTKPAAKCTATDVVQPTVSSFVQLKKYSPTDPKQATFIKNIPVFVAGSLQSFSIVEDEGFRKLISDIDPRIVCPSRYHLSTKLIPETSANIHRKLQLLLETTSDISVTVDLWSNRQMRSFIGITAHFISDWELRSAVLACRRITGRHTADNISAQYEIVNEFNIADKVTHVVSDNASNMVKAFKLPGYVNSHSDSDDTSDTVGSSDTELDDDDPSDVFAHLPQHDGCFAHTVQLVVKDGMKAAGTLRSVIGKASNIVSHARKSTISTELLEGHRKLQAANVTRWNSEITMIRSVLRIPQETLDQLDTMHKLTHHDRILLGELCEILAPF